MRALDKVLDLLGQRLERSDFREGCPVSTVALDVSAESEPIREACVSAYDSWQRVIADHLDGEDAEDLAVVVLAVIEGAVMLARTRRDLAPLHAASARLRVLPGRTP